MKNPEKNIPRAIFISIIGITALYLAMQTSILSVIPWREAAPVAVGGNNAGHGRQRDGACAA